MKSVGLFCLALSLLCAPAVLAAPDDAAKSPPAAEAKDPAAAKRELAFNTSRFTLDMCSSCSTHAGEFYVKAPESPCGQLVDQAIKGDRKARKELVDAFPAYCWPASEQTPVAGLDPAAHDFSGAYIAGDKDYRQSLTITKRPDGRYDVDAFVGNDGCSGGAAGAIGTARGRRLDASVTEEGKTCTLSISVANKGLHVAGSQECNDLHGASCEFDGDYRKGRRR